MSNQDRILKRSEQEKQNCWSVEDLFPSDEAWQLEFDACQELPERISAYSGRLGESAATLLEYLQLIEQQNERIMRLYCYAALRHDEDTARPEYQAMRGRCFSFLVRLTTAGAFAQPELVALPEETLSSFYAAEPGLEKYRRYLTRERLGREHVLSPAEEQLMSSVGEVMNAPSSIFNTFNDADMKFPPVTDSEGKQHVLTIGSYLSILESSDRVLRENAFKSFYSTYNSFRNSLAAMLDAEVRGNVFNARVRHYKSALDAAITPREVPEAVYHSLIESVNANLDKLHRYMELRRRVMGVDELHMYDIYTSMLPDEREEISFERARDEVLEAMRPLGAEYGEVLRRSFEERWMDIYENEGKRSGAYSMGCRVHPFVLLNHKDTLKSEFTLAHELGHAMHSYLSAEKQPPIYADYVIFVAEVASTCNEALLMQYLLRRTEDRKKRAALINYFLEQFRTTLYRQTMFAEFELETHKLVEQGETLTAERLCDIYYALNKKYYGEGMVIDSEIAIEWARIPHFYRNFYVYQYATGFSAAMALSARILKEGEPAVRDYLAFLSGGCSTDPVSLLKIAGVDMSTPEPVNAALKLFGELIDELTELLSE